MIFLRYESFREYIRLYSVISTILAINIFLFLVSTNFQVKLRLFGFAALTDNPLFIGQWWRYVTSIFLHHGIGHLLFNGFSLFLFAPYLERLLGKVRFIILYLAGGIAGNILSVALASKTWPYMVSVGASGAIYGLFGAYVFMTIYRKRYIDAHSSRMVTIILVIGVIYSLIVPNINLLAHLGGFVGGYLISLLLFRQ